MEAGVDRSTAGRFTPLDLPIEPIESIKANASGIYFVGGSATDATAIFSYSKGGQLRQLRSSANDPITREWIAVAEAVTYRAGDRDVHAFYYPPTNPDVTAPPDDRPPLHRRHTRRADRRDVWMCSIRRCSSGPAAALRCST